MRKPAFCVCENKDADQLRGYREADQRLCFRYIDSTIPLLTIYEISSLKPSCVVVQPGLCGALLEFSRDAAHMVIRFHSTVVLSHFFSSELSIHPYKQSHRCQLNEFT